MAVQSWSARVVFAAAVLIPVFARANDAAAFDADKWRFELTPLVWIAGVDGESETRFGGVSTSADFEDVTANLEFGFMGHAEIGKGKWTVLLDGIYIDIGADAMGALGGDLDANVRLALADVGIAYQFVDHPLGSAGTTPRVMVDGIVGGRYIGLEVELDPENLASRSRSADVLDPYVGGRVMLACSKRFTLAFKGTIGGFGVGSDLDWTVGVFADYQLASWCSLLVGYHVMGLEIDEDGRNGLEFDAVFHGPVVGATFRF